MTDWKELLLPLFGGALAIIGGFVSSFLLDRIKREFEKKAVLRNTLEELCALASKITNDAIEYFQQVGVILQGQQLPTFRIPEKTEGTVVRLKILVGFYHPSLLPHVDVLLLNRNEFRERLRAFSDTCRTDGMVDTTVPKLTEIATDCNGLIDELLQNEKELLQASSDVAGRYI